MLRGLQLGCAEGLGQQRGHYQTCWQPIRLLNCNNTIVAVLAVCVLVPRNHALRLMGEWYGSM